MAVRIVIYIIHRHYNDTISRLCFVSLETKNEISSACFSTGNDFVQLNHSVSMLLNQFKYYVILIK